MITVTMDLYDVSEIGGFNDFATAVMRYRAEQQAKTFAGETPAAEPQQPGNPSAAEPPPLPEAPVIAMVTPAGVTKRAPTSAEMETALRGYLTRHSPADAIAILAEFNGAKRYTDVTDPTEMVALYARFSQ